MCVCVCVVRTNVIVFHISSIMIICYCAFVVAFVLFCFCMHHISHFHSNSEIVAITVIVNTAHVHAVQVSCNSFTESIPLTNIVSPTYNTVSGWVSVKTVYCMFFTSHEAQTGMCQCLAFFFFFFFFCIVSNFNMMKTLTLLVHAGLFCCFHSPPNSDMDYRIFNLLMWSFCMHIHMGNLCL